MTPQLGDILIRDVGADSGEFIIVDAVTLRPLRGPFVSLAEALAAGKQLRPGAVLWKENTDTRGRPLGPPIPLPTHYTY